MGYEILELVRHFAIEVLATGIALTLIAFVLIRIRKKWSGPVEPVGFFEWLIRGSDSPERVGVNVEYRDATGALMDFGDLLTGHLRNGRGGSHELHEGCFVNCHPDRIKAGTPCAISIQDGLVKESLRVRLDHDRRILFVQSKFTLKELLDKINNGVLPTHMENERGTGAAKGS